MRHLGFTSSLDNPDVWMRQAKKANGSECYEYFLIYTDDILVVSENDKNVLRYGIGKYFKLIKEESIGPPKLYLGGHVRLVELENGAKARAFSSSQFVQATLQHEGHLAQLFHMFAHLS
jgi:hypothetical protein